MSSKRNDTLILGAALFSMFFGAGNLIFPPFLGLISGDKWNWSMIGFLLTGIGLPLLGIIASAKAGGNVDKLGKKVSPTFSKFLGITIVLAIGPLLAIPRTGATTFEMGILPILPNANPKIASIIYFSIVLVLVIRPTNIIDKLGKILTPGLLILLLLLIIRGIIYPMGVPIEENLAKPFSDGFTQGYQTMDALAAILFGGIVSTSLIQSGYRDKKEQISITKRAGIIAVAGLAFVYGGLGYLGATGGELFPKDISKTDLIMNIANNSLKSFGELGLGLAVALACMTTAVGLTATVGQYFSEISNEKLKYETIVVITTLFSAIISFQGVEAIINFAEPILLFMYPMVIVLILSTVFLDDYINNNNIYKYSIYATLIVSAIETLSMLKVGSFLAKFISILPLHSSGFPWLIPAIIGGFIGYFIKPNEDTILIS
ncbi:branched-chain amino acid transport system II carrier protein [Wansuia hejianensis]|uniref:Branched-chain amino acid transport system carrier protein n=1 Tax=Wansuia hejianensis TaxID=2763667 RepID=A0A926F069_9FIRM|nr:branched-chain amino acid transport system II carrier protein [Wansuia hejianensis]MBC8591623.1 branched-chain amino acid transport system II carrier protein [Wansuia hejianensis]